MYVLEFATAMTTTAKRLMRAKILLRKLISAIVTFIAVFMNYCKLTDGRSFSSTAAVSYSGPPASIVESETAPVIIQKVRGHFYFHWGTNCCIFNWKESCPSIH